jgi:branched-chain amino acid aminotransferase
MRGNSSRIFLFDEYFEYMISAISHYGMQKPSLLKKSIFEKDIELLLQKNRIYKEFSVSVSIFRNGGAPKMPTDNSISILISVDALPYEFFALNDKGLKIDILNNYKLHDFILNSEYDMGFSPEFLMQKKIETANLDDILLQDEKGYIVKSLEATVFFVKNGNIILPQKFQNTYHKIFTKFIINLAINLNIPVIEFDIRAADLSDVDEIFLANPVSGIKWVLAYKEKRYFNKMSSLLVKELNKYFRQSQPQKF